MPVDEEFVSQYESYYSMKRLVKKEIIQKENEGCDVSGYKERYENSEKEEEYSDIFEDLQTLEVVEDFPFEEPSELPEIRKLRPDGPRKIETNMDIGDVRDKLVAGYYGRSAGCQLGSAVEAWNIYPSLNKDIVYGCRDKIEKRLKKADDYPLSDYFSLEIFDEEMKPLVKPFTKGNIKRVEPNDDLNYTLLNLSVLQKYGHDFKPIDVGRTWMELMPYYETHTAERMAYKNLINRIHPPESAVHLNPYREWIGARIRADTWGYVCPGNPELAAELAYNDAALSHVKNGIYGEMLTSAMIAAAFVKNDIEDIVEIGLSEIPSESRLSKAIKEVLELWHKDIDWKKMLDEIWDRFGHYSWVHTINTTALTIGALLWGENYTEVIGIATMGGLDTDCDAATAGSIYGVMKGMENISDEEQEKWFDPLNNTIASNIGEWDGIKITEAADKTLDLTHL